MKILLVSIFMIAATAAPLNNDGPLAVIVTGDAESKPFEIKDILMITVKEHINREQVATTNLLHPFSAQVLAEAAAVGAADGVPTAKYLTEPDDYTPYNIEVITLPEIEPEIIISAPEPVLPEVVEVIEAPAVVEVLPVPAAQVPNGEIFDEGNVPVAPEDVGILATLQSWFNMALNYFNNGVAVTQKLV